MPEDMGALTGSREPSPTSGLGPAGFDPERGAVLLARLDEMLATEGWRRFHLDARGAETCAAAIRIALGQIGDPIELCLARARHHYDRRDQFSKERGATDTVTFASGTAGDAALNCAIAIGREAGLSEDMVLDRLFRPAGQ